MESINRTTTTVEKVVNAPVEKVWQCWTTPKDIMNWCHASDDWHAPYAENDLTNGGRFKTTMAAKDGSFSFDIGGSYTKIERHKLIEYTLDDDRKVKIQFIDGEGKTTVIESFEAEGTNLIDMQQRGWQAILNNFKKYTEGK